MNPLAILKEKLIIKPIVEDRKPVEVVIKQTKTKITKPKKTIKREKDEEKDEEEKDEEEQDDEEQDEEQDEADEDEGRKKTQIIFEDKDKGYDREGLYKKLLENNKL